MTTGSAPTIVDSDGHIIESIEEMAEFLDPPIRDTALGTGGIGTIIELSKTSLFGTLDGLHFTNVAASGNATARRERINASDHRMGSAQDWKALLDKSGMAETVVYTTEGLQVGKLRNKEYAVGLCRGYNDYVANCYQGYDSRIHPIALIPMQDPARAALELRRAVKDLGLLGAMLPSTGLDLHLGHEYYWPVYQEASDLGCILAVHGGSNVGIGIDSFTDLTPSGIVHHPVPLLYAFVSFIYDGVFERFPRHASRLPRGRLCMGGTGSGQDPAGSRVFWGAPSPGGRISCQRQPPHRLRGRRPHAPLPGGPGRDRALRLLV